MKSFIFILILCPLFFSCKKNTVQPQVVPPNIDFTIDNTLNIFEYFLHKVDVDCSVSTPYWENKSLKLKGIIDTSQAYNNVYLFDNFTGLSKATMVLYVSNADSSNILKKIRVNPLKRCVIKINCQTDVFSANGVCSGKWLSPIIEKAEDITIQ
jgi:hypothetical protein